MICDINGVTEDLLKMLKKAVRQSGNTVLKCKRKTVSTEYDEELKKPLAETTEETEEVKELKGTVDVGSLKTITGLLKEISEMNGNNQSGQDGGGVVLLADIKELENE